MTRRALAVGALLIAVGAAHGASDDLDELMQLLSARKHGQVSFVEQHFLKLLKRPTESFGELVYDAPDRLEKRTAEPRQETLVLAGDEVTLSRRLHTRVVDLKSYPQILPFVESIRATLAGDRPALERVFELSFAGSLAGWSLTLVPRDTAAAVAQIHIVGSRDQLSTVEIRERDGDRSLMTLRAHPTP